VVSKKFRGPALFRRPSKQGLRFKFYPAFAGLSSHLKHTKAMIFSVIPAERLRFTGFPPKFKLLFEKSTIKHIMRIGLGILFVITTSIQLVFAADVKSQSIDEVEVRVELKNESLVKAFQKIEAQSPFRFMYRLKEVKDIRHLSTTNTRTSVEDLLKTLLANTSLTYRQIDNQVLIVSAGKPETGDIALAGEKPRSADVLIEVIRGRVTDANGEPLAGVSVSRGSKRNIERNQYRNHYRPGWTVFD